MGQQPRHELMADLLSERRAPDVDVTGVDPANGLGLPGRLVQQAARAPGHARITGAVEHEKRTG